MRLTLNYLFDRYCHWNIAFAGAPQALKLKDGSLVGYIENFEIAGDLATIDGWSLLDGLSITTVSKHQDVRRRLYRGDVTTALGRAYMNETGNADGRVGFAAEIDWHEGSVMLCSVQGQVVYHWPLPVPTTAQRTIAVQLAARSFFKTVAKNLPLAFRYLLNGRKPHHKEALKTRFGLVAKKPSSRTLSRQFINSKSLPPPTFKEPFAIIMPIYNAFDMLEESLRRVVINTDLPWHLILVEDASPDPRVRPWLREWANAHGDQVTLFENTENLGFIGSVNRGLAHASKLGRHVVLLNSDAFVPKNWASRLLQPILVNAHIASVTPMSNDATIFSIPTIAGTVQLPCGAVDEIDAVASHLSSTSYAEAPSGVGFCMAINRDALKKVPALDTAFGLGYGEEVDWCQKLINRGMKHVGIGNLFVEHRGGSSFGSETKIRAMEKASEIIKARYPYFDDDVQDFIKQDPLFTARLYLSIAYAAARQKAPLDIYLAHSMGGGANHWLKARIRNTVLEGRSSVVIRIGGSKRFVIELHMDDDIMTGETDEIAIVAGLIPSIPQRHVVYSCGVGDSTAIELPELLCTLSGGEGATMEVMFHDFLPISPSFNLLDSDGVYRGVPSLDNDDPVHQPRLPDGRQGTLRAWRLAWGAMLTHANSVRVFSGSSRDIVLQAWPDISEKIHVTPHSLTHNIPALEAAQPLNGHKVALALLGDIGDVKGAQFVSDLAWHLQREKAGFDLVVIGGFDRSFSLPPEVVVTGRYNILDLEQLAQKHRIAAWLMPSICPETFSFTTHEMLATGLPVFAFAIGAQGEAVAAATNGRIIEQTIDAVIVALHNETIKK